MTDTSAIPGISADPAADLFALRNIFETRTAVDRTNGWLDGSLPRIPAMALLGVTPRRADPSGSLVDLELRPDMLGPGGQLPAGLLAYLTDVIAGTACSTLSNLRPMVTVTITVEPVVDEFPTEGYLAASGKVISTRGDRLFAQGEIRAASRPGEIGDRLLARVGSWFLVLGERPGGRSSGPFRLPQQPPAPDLGLGPVAQLIGINSLERGPGTARAILPMRSEIMNLALMLHGGIGALYADLVCAAALGEGETYRPLTSTYSYLRSAGAGGSDVEVKARVLKPGRAVATVEAEISSAEGKPALHVITNAARVLTGGLG